ncbi:hypothetical protein T03_5069 [Trichinella britovi]|uniref:Uncharacterized protein n=1 Tax=Trichinella britovi TaxID=45882 RepID=A0A0V1DHX6_TRIBR|nr:hypothetical protein T03_5069 [Trichinella britovi]
MLANGKHRSGSQWDIGRFNLYIINVFNQGNSVNKNLKLFGCFFLQYLKNNAIRQLPINGLKLNIIFMLTFPEICY